MWGLPRSLTEEERLAMIEWTRGHGINHVNIPRDGIDIDPGEGWTRIEWFEFQFDDSGHAVLTEDGYAARVGPFERVVRGLPPFAVVAGEKHPPTY